MRLVKSSKLREGGGQRKIWMRIISVGLERPSKPLNRLLVTGRGGASRCPRIIQTQKSTHVLGRFYPAVGRKSLPAPSCRHSRGRLTAIKHDFSSPTRKLMDKFLLGGRTRHDDGVDYLASAALGTIRDGDGAREVERRRARQHACPRPTIAKALRRAVAWVGHRQSWSDRAGRGARDRRRARRTPGVGCGWRRARTRLRRIRREASSPSLQPGTTQRSSRRAGSGASPADPLACMGTAQEAEAHVLVPRLGAWEFGLWPPVGGLSR